MERRSAPIAAISPSRGVGISSTSLIMTNRALGIAFVALLATASETSSNGLARGKVPLALPLISQRQGGSILLRRPPCNAGQNSTGVDTVSVSNGFHKSGDLAASSPLAARCSSEQLVNYSASLPLANGTDGSRNRLWSAGWRVRVNADEARAPTGPGLWCQLSHACTAPCRDSCHLLGVARNA